MKSVSVYTRTFSIAFPAVTTNYDIIDRHFPTNFNIPTNCFIKIISSCVNSASGFTRRSIVPSLWVDFFIYCYRFVFCLSILTMKLANGSSFPDTMTRERPLLPTSFHPGLRLRLNDLYPTDSDPYPSSIVLY